MIVREDYLPATTLSHRLAARFAGNGALKGKIKDRWANRPAAKVVAGEAVPAKPVNKRQLVGIILGIAVAVTIVVGLLVRARVVEMRLLTRFNMVPTTKGWQQFNDAAVFIVLTGIAVFLACELYGRIVKKSSEDKPTTVT